MIRGPTTAEVLVVGEAPGETEERLRQPFVGASGMELERMLTEAGFDPKFLCFANVCNVRPPRNNIEAFFPKNSPTRINGRAVSNEISQGVTDLERLIDSMPRLRLILALGSTPLWALAGKLKITKWRGSQLFIQRSRPIALIPTYHPAAIFRQWDWRFIAVLDFKRAKRWLDNNLKEPEYVFTTRPSYQDTCDFLTSLLGNLHSNRTVLSVDLETRLRHIACLGISTDAHRGYCIPFMEARGSYWSPEQESNIIWQLYQIFTHPNALIIGQNFLYDRQYIARSWGFRAPLHFDTMIAHHLAFPALPKGLDFIASFYNDHHVYWKDESKDWDPKLGENQLWLYNCKDACAAYEAYEHITTTLTSFGLLPQLAEQHRFAELAFDMMLRGILTDTSRRDEIAAELRAQMAELAHFIFSTLGYELDLLSPKQVMTLAYKVLQLPPVYKERTKGVKTLSADKEAIELWLETGDPLYRPILEAIRLYRSLSVYLNTFILAPIDPDQHFRCSINVSGTSTFRFSTSSDAFGYGTNMQNIPKGDKE